MRRLVVGALLVLVAATGCAKHHKLVIESDTCWQGSISQRVGIGGCGDKTYQLVGRVQCVRVQKTSGPGYLRVTLDNLPTQETSISLGDVEICE